MHILSGVFCFNFRNHVTLLSLPLTIERQAKTHGHGRDWTWEVCSTELLYYRRVIKPSLRPSLLRRGTQCKKGCRNMQNFWEKSGQQNPGGCGSHEEGVATRQWERARREGSSWVKERVHGERESKHGRLSAFSSHREFWEPVTVNSENREILFFLTSSCILSHPEFPDKLRVRFLFCSCLKLLMSHNCLLNNKLVFGKW